MREAKIMIMLAIVKSTRIVVAMTGVGVRLFDPIKFLLHAKGWASLLTMFIDPSILQLVKRSDGGPRS